MLVEQARKELVANPGADLIRPLPWSVASDDQSVSGLIGVTKDGEDTEESAHDRM